MARNRRLKRVRERAGLSARELAEKVGRTQPLVAHWEGGRRRPTPRTLARLVEVLGVDGPADLGYEVVYRPEVRQL